MKHKKQAKSKSIPEPAKQPRSIDVSAIDAKLAWSFRQFDPCRLWLDDCESADFVQVAGHMKSYEQRTWREIDGNQRRDHSIPTAELCKEAQERLVYLHKDDVAELWRFRFMNKQRLWGIRVENIFYALWWDPEHRVYPVVKRHT